MCSVSAKVPKNKGNPPMKKPEFNRTIFHSNEEYGTITSVSDYLGCGPETLKALCEQCGIRLVKIGPRYQKLSPAQVKELIRAWHLKRRVPK